GELDDRTRRDADVLVRTDADGTTIVVDDREIPFDRLRSRDRGRRNGSDEGDDDARRDRIDPDSRRERDDGGRSEVSP
ncbi:hypothetical protein ACFQE6_23735, partial [Natrinema soli]